jgi:hypothetical protein
MAARFRSVLSACLGGCLVYPGATLAQETTSYTYDALGRLITTANAGGPNDGISSTYAFDPASNRTSVAVTTSSGGAGNCSFAISDAGIGAQSGGVMQFTIRKTGTCSTTTVINFACSTTTVINFASRDGTAVGHYTPTSGSVAFTPADTTKFVRITMDFGDASLANLDVYMAISIASGPGIISDTSGRGYYYDAS